jgi:hypothetical protein
MAILIISISILILPQLDPKISVVSDLHINRASIPMNSDTPYQISPSSCMSHLKTIHTHLIMVRTKRKTFLKIL